MLVEKEWLTVIWLNTRKTTLKKGSYDQTRHSLLLSYLTILKEQGYFKLSL